MLSFICAIRTLATNGCKICGHGLVRAEFEFILMGHRHYNGKILSSNFKGALFVVNYLRLSCLKVWLGLGAYPKLASGSATVLDRLVPLLPHQRLIPEPMRLIGIDP